MYSRICDKCKKICQKTAYGSCVILCKEDKILCMKCNFERLLFNEFSLYPYMASFKQESYPNFYYKFEN